METIIFLLLVAIIAAIIGVWAWMDIFKHPEQTM